MKKLRFEAPEGWAYTYDEGEENFYDEEGVVFDSCYVERLVASDKDGTHSFQVAAFHWGLADDVLDLIQQEVEDYLNNSGFVIPEYLMPSSMDLIERCQISGNDAYYYLIQKPGEEKADIRMIFAALDGTMVFIDASTNNWWDAELMIIMLSENLSFVEG